MFTVTTKLDPYEIDGDKRKGLPNEADELHVKQHWNQRRDLVVLDWRGHNITVSASELAVAIRNATNEP